MKRAWTLVTGILLALVCLTLATPGGLPAAWAADPIELSFAIHIPPKAGPFVNAFVPWAKEIEKRSNGKLTIKFYPAQTLASARDAYDAVKNGVADITWVPFSLNRGRFPLFGVMELPFLSPDTYTGSHALVDLYKKFPEMSRELKDVHLLSLWVSLSYEIHTVNKPVRTLEDVRGMKLATMPGASRALVAVGATPVTVSLPGVYTMLEKGVADGTALAWGAFKAFKIYEVTKYHTNAHLGGVPYCHIMNKARWKSLPKNLQEIIATVTAEMFPDILCKAVTTESNAGIKISRERGDDIIDLTPEQQKAWIATAEGVWQEWAKKMEGKGLPGQAMLKEAVALVEKYKDYGANK